MERTRMSVGHINLISISPSVGLPLTVEIMSTVHTKKERREIEIKSGRQIEMGEGTRVKGRERDDAAGSAVLGSAYTHTYLLQFHR